MAPSDPRPPATTPPVSPGLPCSPGLSCPVPAVSPENLICSQDPKTSRGPRLPVQSFSLASSEVQTRGSTTCPLGHMGSHQASNVWQKQMTDSSAHRPHPPGRSALPGGAWFLPLALPPVAPDRGPASTILWPQSLLATQQPPGSSCQVTAAASSLSWPPPSTHGPAAHPLTAARVMLLKSQIMTLLC